MASYEFASFFQTLDNWGVTDVLLPFILVFTLFFAILQKTKILGEEKKNFNAIIAMVMGFTVVIPHISGNYPLNYDPVDIINGFLPGISLLVLAVIMLFILIGLWGGEATWVGGSPSAIVAVLCAIAVLWIFGASAGWWQGWDWFVNIFGEDVVSLLIIILVFGIIIWFITKEDKTQETNAFKNFLHDTSKIFGGGKK